MSLESELQKLAKRFTPEARRKRLYSRLAFCILTARKWEAHANAKWAAYYWLEVEAIRRRLDKARSKVEVKLEIAA
jgi:thermostable 8-oxoguanine DNA glycosylase